MDSIYDILLQMPLFQGVSPEHLTEILEKVRFDFRKASKGETIAYQGEFCSELIFVIKGKLSSRCEVLSESPFQVMEYYDAPELIEPYSLMGYQSCYTSTYNAAGDVHYFVISKLSVLSCLCEYEIFRMNFLNLLSRRAQLLRLKIMAPSGVTVSAKIYNWMRRMCEKETGRKVFKIRMEDLAALIDETRLNVSKLLNEWQEQGLLRLSRLRIEVSAMEALKEIAT